MLRAGALQRISAVSRNYQKRLEQDRERYRLALEATNDCIFEYDMHTDVLRSFQMLYSASPKDGLQNTVQLGPQASPQGNVQRYELDHFRSRVRGEDFAHPDDAAEVEACICEGVQSNKSFRLRRSPDPLGQYYWYTIHNRLVCHQGKTVRVVGTLRNVEQQKLSARIIEQFVYNNCDYFVLIDAKTNAFTTFSAHASGTPVPPPHGTDYAQQVRDFAEHHVLPELRAETISNMSMAVVLPALDAHGEFSFFSGDNDPSRGPTHKKLTFAYYDKDKKQILLTKTDVTHIFNEEARKRAELSHALQLARDASNAKTEFLSRMSHDLRTPLNAIMGMTAIAKLKLNTDHAPNLESLLACCAFTEECLEKIDVSSRYLLTLLNSILDLSRLDSAQLNLSTDPLSLAAFMADIDALFHPQALAAGLDFQVHLDPRLPLLFAADRARLEQVLMNLLSNALKFTPQGGSISLAVSLVQSPAEADLVTQNAAWVEFLITDSGIGISPDFLPKAFDPFEQEYADYARNQVGTGLGLPIVKSIVQLMHGSVHLESSPQHGCTVAVRLPMNVLQACEIIVPELGPPVLECPLTSSGKLFHGQNILLVEDNEINQEIAQVLLEDEGLRVDIAEHGKIAVDKFDHAEYGHYAAILMDIRMPVMDGLAATQAIRALPRVDATTIPIIALTANAFQDDMNQAMAAGMNSYLTKPADPGLLYGTLKSYIG